MSEHPLGIDRREFLCASTKGAAVLALLPDLFKAAVSFHSGSKASSEAKQAEKRFHASDGETPASCTFCSFDSFDPSWERGMFAEE